MLHCYTPIDSVMLCATMQDFEREEKLDEKSLGLCTDGDDDLSHMQQMLVRGGYMIRPRWV